MHNTHCARLAGLLRVALLSGFAAVIWIGLGAVAASAAPALVPESPAEIRVQVAIATVSAPEKAPAAVDAQPADTAAVPVSPGSAEAPVEPVSVPVATLLVPAAPAAIGVVEPVLAAPVKVLPAEVLPAAVPLATVVEPVVASVEPVIRTAVDPVANVKDVVEIVMSAPAAAVHIGSSAPKPIALSGARVSITEVPNRDAFPPIDVVDGQMPDFNAPLPDAGLSTAAIPGTTVDQMPLAERQATPVTHGPAGLGGLPRGPAASTSSLSVFSGAQSSAGWLSDTSPVYTPVFGAVPDSSWLLPASLTSDPGSSPD